MPLEIAKILDERALEGEELLEELAERCRKHEIKAIQDKRLIFTRIRTYLEKVFGSFYTTEKNEPMNLLTLALQRLQQNPHLKGREEKIVQLGRLLDNLAENGFLKLRHGQSEERDFTILGQRLTVTVEGGEQKVYETVRRIPSDRKAAEEEKQRLIRYREELKVIEQVRLTSKQLINLFSLPSEDEIRRSAADTARGWFERLDRTMLYAHYILIGKGYIEDDFIAEIKLESLDLAQEMKDRSTTEKMLFLASLNWYRNQWASRSFNEPDNLVFFLVGRLVNRHAPWNPRGDTVLREALATLGVPLAELEQAFIRQAAGSQRSAEEDQGSVKVDRRREKLLQLVTQVTHLGAMLAARPSVDEGNTLLKKFLRPGIRTPVSRRNMELIAEEIRSQVKLDCLGKIMFNLSSDERSANLVSQLRMMIGEGSVDLFQQLQAFRVAHGLSNLFESKERERLAAFISPADLIQFISQMAAGQVRATRIGPDKIEFFARSASGEAIDTAARTLSSKGVSYEDAARLINREFENLLLSYDRDEFAGRLSDCNPDYTRENDHHARIRQYAWICNRYPFLKIYFGAALLLVSPVMHNILEGERRKEEKTIHKTTAEFMDKVVELEQHLLERIEAAAKKLEVSVLDRDRAEHQFVAQAGPVPEAAGGDGGAEGARNYVLALEEGVHEVFPKLGFELQVLLEQSGQSGEEEAEVAAELAERGLTDEERAFEEKYGHLMEHHAAEEGQRPAPILGKRSVQRLNEALENIAVFFERLKAEGYDRRIPVLRRDQIVANIRDGCYYIRDILGSLNQQQQQDAIKLLRRTEKLLQQARQSLQQVELFEEKLNLEEENAEVPLYEIHSILVTLNASYLPTLGSLVEIISQKLLTGGSGFVKRDQVEGTRKLVEHIEACLGVLVRNARAIRLESPKLPTGLRDAMCLNITSVLGEINRLKRSQLIIQSCQHPNDLRIYLNVLARELLERRLTLPLANIQATLKKVPTFMDDQTYAVWRAGGEEQLSGSLLGKLEIPTITLNEAPRVVQSVVTIADQLADHLQARGEEFRRRLAEQKQRAPERTDFEEFSERLSTNVSGRLGQLHAFFVPDKANNITFDPDRLEDLLRLIGAGVGELLNLIRDFTRNKAAFAKEIEALRKIAPLLEGLRNCINDYNASYLKQRKAADLARSQTNCDKTLISFCHELGKFDDPTSVEYKVLILRGRVYLALENMVQRVMGTMKSDFNPERRKLYQQLVNELFYMMSHVRTEVRDLPLLKKFTQGALRAAEGCGNPELAREVTALLTRGEELVDWLKVAESGFAENAVGACYTPGVDLERLRKLSESF